MYYERAIANRWMIPKVDDMPTKIKYHSFALQDYARCYELNPSYNFGVYGLSEIYRQLRNYDMQLALLREAISKDPQRLLYWQLYFERLSALKRFDEIREVCRLGLLSGSVNQHELRGVLAKLKSRKLICLKL